MAAALPAAVSAFAVIRLANWTKLSGRSGGMAAVTAASAGVPDDGLVELAESRLNVRTLNCVRSAGADLAHDCQH
jgi:hypothetical protein